MTIETFFNLVVVIFTVGNLGAMELNVREAIEALRNAKVVVLIVVWSWVVGPALACLITKTLPLRSPTPSGLAPRMRGAGW